MTAAASAVKNSVSVVQEELEEEYGPQPLSKLEVCSLFIFLRM